MDFTEPNWLSFITSYTWFPLRHWLCLYFAIFPLLNGCSPSNNLPCARTYRKIHVTVLKCSLTLAPTPALSTLSRSNAYAQCGGTTPPPTPSAMSYSGTSTLFSILDAISIIIAGITPTTPPSKAVGRLPALG